MNPMNCQHTWETLDDGTQICFECDERKPTPKGRDIHRPERNEMKKSKQIHADWMSFRRNCRLTDPRLGRPVKRWRVPGTQEHGKDAMFSRMWNDAKERGK